MTNLTSLPLPDGVGGASLGTSGLTAAMHHHFSVVLGAGGFFDWFHKAWFRADSATDFGTTTDSIGMWLWWFCTLWFVFLMVLMFAFVAMYRRKKGRIAPRSPSHNTPLEIAWTVIPTLFLVYIFFRGFWSYMDKVVTPGNAVEMNLVAQKWNWNLTYPNGSQSPWQTKIGSQSIPVYYMPADRPIRMLMSSQDVMHAFFVPDFRIKTDIFPNRYTTIWFKAHAPAGGKTHPRTIADFEAAQASAKANGQMYVDAPYVKGLEGEAYEDHWLFCAEYCGDNHSEMAAIIRIVDDAAYTRWLDTIGTGSLPLPDLGKRLYTTKGCVSCHTIDDGKNTGPTWKNMFGHAVEFTDGSSYTAEQMGDVAFFSNYARESMLVPGAKIVKGFGPQMSSQAGILSERDIAGLIAYIETLSDAAPKPAAADEASKGTVTTPEGGPRPGTPSAPGAANISATEGSTPPANPAAKPPANPPAPQSPSAPK